MPKRIVRQPVIVHRDGKQVAPEMGKEFDFTDAELKDINRLNPKALEHIVLNDSTSTKTTVAAKV